MELRFIEQWEYHEIAAAQAIPIGTVQWRIFNVKKKLAPQLMPVARGRARAACFQNPGVCPTVCSNSAQASKYPRFACTKSACAL